MRGKIVLLKRRLVHDEMLLRAAVELFENARNEEEQVFPFRHKKLGGLRQHNNDRMMAREEAAATRASS